MTDDFFNDIRDLLTLQGFVHVGIADVHEISEDVKKRHENWINAGKNGTMKFFERVDYRETYDDPRFKHPFAKSIVSAAFPYNVFNETAKTFTFAGGYKVSRYALNQDYHKVLNAKLDIVLQKLRFKYPENHFAVQVDAGAMPEIYWAENTGIGFRRKNGLLYVPEYGSFVFLVLIVTDIESVKKIDKVKPDDFCSKCNKCVEACPTKAIAGDYTIDARRCVSYLTIEHKGDFKTGTQLDGWIFGCDVCQQVCPFNQQVTVTHDKNFEPAEFWQEITVEKLHNMSNSSFRKRFNQSPLARTGLKRLLRNIDANL